MEGKRADKERAEDAGDLRSAPLALFEGPSHPSSLGASLIFLLPVT